MSEGAGAMSEDLRLRITAIRTVGVPVRDQDRALDFYVGTLGLEKQMDAPVPQLGGRWIVVAPPEQGATIALLPEREDVPAGIETGIRLGTEDAEADHASLGAAGVDVGELLRWEGIPPMFTVRDPDGNGLEIVEDW
jgi:lactoylglutathione lyase